MTAPWVLHQLDKQFFRGSDEPQGDLRTVIVDADSVSIVANSPIKCRMNEELSAHPQSLSSSFEIAPVSQPRRARQGLRESFPRAKEAGAEIEPQTAANQFAELVEPHRPCINRKSSCPR